MSISPKDLSRREFCLGMARAAGGMALAGCGGLLDGSDDGVSVHLSARPSTPTMVTGPGIQTIAGNGVRAGVLSVPLSYTAPSPIPLVVALHGAGGNADFGINLLKTRSESEGFAILSPQSVGPTWDAILGVYGPDVPSIDNCLRFTFERIAVQPERIYVMGFSDGASYALGFGLSNGDVFSRVVAFSPGFVPESDSRGKPPIFVSHGTHDTVLPIDQASRRIVPLLRQNGYQVDYREFTGGHQIPTEMLDAATEFLFPG